MLISSVLLSVLSIHTITIKGEINRNQVFAFGSDIKSGTIFCGACLASIHSKLQFFSQAPVHGQFWLPVHEAYPHQRVLNRNVTLFICSADWWRVADKDMSWPQDEQYTSVMERLIVMITSLMRLRVSLKINVWSAATTRLLSEVRWLRQSAQLKL